MHVDLATMEGNDVTLCRPGRLVEADIHLCRGVNRLPNLTHDRRPILTPLSDGLGR